MPHMTNPHDGLVEFQKALDQGLIQLSPCEVHKDITVFKDEPDGTLRLTFAALEGTTVKAYAVFILAEPLKGLSCFSAGYAVPEAYRKQRLGTDILTKAIDELRNGFGNNGVSEFYIEAIVSRDNDASKRLLAKVFKAVADECVDEESGTPALAYHELITT
ncbi:GNAT family N-acetyltransferase [Neptuniibacter sp. QD37_11]|uniref:GNAT family N-acetyltransferase n=1 Tax=Neptuniibacter sp. QD37_11 TaxID=3398209 RepID=UPI0039F5865C